MKTKGFTPFSKSFITVYSQKKKKDKEKQFQFLLK